MRPVEDEPAGVVVPPELAGLVAVLLGYGLDAFEARNGGVPDHPGLRLLRARLQAAGASARGRARRTLVLPERSDIRYLSVREAAPVMGVSPRQVRRLAEAGAILALKSGRDWWISAQAAEQYPGRRRAWQEVA
ncbi:excisionase family DNA-binding protein [Streptomyces sp. NPDC001118]